MEVWAEPSCDSNIRGLLSSPHRISQNKPGNLGKIKLKFTDQRNITECIELYRLAFVLGEAEAPVGTTALGAGWFQPLKNLKIFEI